MNKFLQRKKELLLAKALFNASKQLNINQAKLSIILGVHPKTISRLKKNQKLDPKTKQGERALLLIQTAIGLNSLTDGNSDWIKHFMKTQNQITGGIPNKQIESINGLFSVLQAISYLQRK